MFEQIASKPLDVCGVVVATCIENALKRQIRIYAELLFEGVKQPGREADHSAPASTEVKKM
jgi:hypothetical protein